MVGFRYLPRARIVWTPKGPGKMGRGLKCVEAAKPNYFNGSLKVSMVVSTFA